MEVDGVESVILWKSMVYFSSCPLAARVWSSLLCYYSRGSMHIMALPMDALKGHSNGTILGCQKMDDPMYTKKGMEFLRVW